MHCFLAQIGAAQAVMGKREPRAATAVDAYAVSKILKANCTTLKDYLLPDIEDVIAVYQDFLVDLCTVTPRITKPILMQACDLAYESQVLSANEIGSWANQMIACVTHVRPKIKSMSSGVKLAPHVLSVAKALAKWSNFKPKMKLRSPLKVSNQGMKAMLVFEMFLIFMFCCCWCCFVVVVVVVFVVPVFV